jgi:cysteine desulfurase
MHYLDWAASTPPYEDIIKASVDTAVRCYGNPSSRHAAGRLALEKLERARAMVATAIGSNPGQLSFTSGGTEADSIALLSILAHPGASSIVISELEHAAVYEQARLLETLGVKVIRVRPDSDGIMQASRLADAVRSDTKLVAVMAVNNETGAVQPVAELVAAVRRATKEGGRSPFFHCDAVQAIGKIPFNAESLGIDSAAFSAHKTGGPRGVGGLYLRRPLQTLAQGGGQESGIRPGTSNTAGAEAFAQSLDRSMLSFDATRKNALKLERELMDGVSSIPGVTILPPSRKPGDPRFVPHIVCVAFPGLGGETMARLMDEAGVYISTGAACSGIKKERRVLDSMGTPQEYSFSAVRISTGRDTDSKDIEAFLEQAKTAYKRFKV